MQSRDARLTSIVVFYDGMHFKHVSDYYNYFHHRRARINISGLHKFVCELVAEREGVNPKFCRIVDAHYFRGRISALEAEEQNLLLNERKFEDVLISEGVTAHFLPLRPSSGEKGIDVWLSLEAFDLAISKRYDICVLITGDADYLPLVRKLNTLGIRVMLLAWDIEYVDRRANRKSTKTSQDLIDAVTYPVLMDKIIDDLSRQHDKGLDDLFLKPSVTVSSYPDKDYDKEYRLQGKIINLQGGYGFIKPNWKDGNNTFFHHSVVVNGEFNDLQVDDQVEYILSTDPPEEGKGPPAIEVRKI